MKVELLRMEGITLEENGRRSLNSFHMNLFKGETLGVFSNHASVKSTLVKLITGTVQPQCGRMYLEREPCISNAQDPIQYRKVALIDSVNTLIDALSVSENIFVIRKGFKAHTIHNRLLHEQTQNLMQEFELSIQPGALVGNLSTWERCVLEIIKAYALGAVLIVLKDLSSYLSDFEIDQLCTFVERLKAKGVGFLLIDSSSEHLNRYADRIIVIKKGRNSWTFKKGEFSQVILQKYFYPDRTSVLSIGSAEQDESNLLKQEVLVFNGVSTDVLDKTSFVLHKGEALSVFDHDGHGIEEIKRLLMGEQKNYEGSMVIDGHLFYASNPWKSLDQKIAFILENPSETMLFPHFTAIENLCFASSRKTADFWINPAYLASCLREYEPYFDPGTLKKYPDGLTMKDLHKLVYCRWHLYNPSVVVCMKPFSSVDRGLKDISTTFIEMLLKKGISVLILTSNFSEIDIPCQKISITTKECPTSPEE